MSVGVSRERTRHIDLPRAPTGPDQETRAAHPGTAGQGHVRDGGLDKQTDVVGYLLVLGPLDRSTCYFILRVYLPGGAPGRAESTARPLPRPARTMTPLHHRPPKSLLSQPRRTFFAVLSNTAWPDAHDLTSFALETPAPIVPWAVYYIRNSSLISASLWPLLPHIVPSL